MQNASEIAGVSASLLSQYQDEFNERYMPVHIVRRLEGVTGCFAVSEHLAAQRPSVLIHYPREDGHRNWEAHSAAISERYGALMADGAEVLKQGEPDRKAARRVAEERVKPLLRQIAILYQSLLEEDWGGGGT